jgi:GNAT superfamily N-acetyltransferase
MSGDYGPRLAILFRQMDNPVPDKWVAGLRWQIEAHLDGGERPHPIGLAWVSDPAPLPPGSGCRERARPAWLDFILVLEGYRRHGVATALVRACRERWPGLWLTPGITEDGWALKAGLRRMGISDGGESANENRRRPARSAGGSSRRASR